LDDIKSKEITAKEQFEQELSIHKDLKDEEDDFFEIVQKATIKSRSQSPL
jgi:hypothetical protein